MLHPHDFWHRPGWPGPTDDYPQAHKAKKKKMFPWYCIYKDAFVERVTNRQGHTHTHKSFSSFDFTTFGCVSKTKIVGSHTRCYVDNQLGPFVQISFDILFV